MYLSWLKEGNNSLLYKLLWTLKNSSNSYENHNDNTPNSWRKFTNDSGIHRFKKKKIMHSGLRVKLAETKGCS